MASKYIDLNAEIISRENIASPEVRAGVGWALDYLDAHPDRAPGRTMTESGCRDLYHAAQYGVKSFRGELEDQGFAFIADPEPTNAEKLERVLEAFDADDDALDLSEYLDKAGVKAPGGDDE